MPRNTSNSSRPSSPCKQRTQQQSLPDDWVLMESSCDGILGCLSIMPETYRCWWEPDSQSSWNQSSAFWLAILLAVMHTVMIGDLLACNKFQDLRYNKFQVRASSYCVKKSWFKCESPSGLISGGIGVFEKKWSFWQKNILKKCLRNLWDWVLTPSVPGCISMSNCKKDVAPLLMHWS